MKFKRGVSKKLMAVALLAALIALLMAAPVSSSHTCSEGADDYNQCVAQNVHEDETSLYGGGYDAPWYESCDETDPEDDSCS